MNDDQSHFVEKSARTAPPQPHPRSCAKRNKQRGRRGKKDKEVPNSNPPEHLEHDTRALFIQTTTCKQKKEVLESKKRKRSTELKATGTWKFNTPHAE